MKHQKFNIKVLHKPKCLCYNGIMLKTKTKVKISVAGLMLAVSAFLFNSQWNNASAGECTDPTCDTTFQVNVKDTLSVSITAPGPGEWASGDAGEFLRNSLNLTASTNTSGGLSAYMYSKDSTNLVNAIDSSKTIQTLASSVQRSAFVDNRWGYSLDDTSAGSSSSNYSPMGDKDHHITLASSVASCDEDIYFGTKADINQASGAYLGVVVFQVVTSADPGPTPPSPVNPDDDTPGSGATYDNNSNRTVYTTISSTSTTTTTTTQVSPGNVTSMYPLGETTRTESNISDGSQVATGLAIAASSAAAGGMVFFILAKRREDDEEDEEELQ